MISTFTGDDFPEPCMLAGRLEVTNEPLVSQSEPVDKAKLWHAVITELEDRTRSPMPLEFANLLVGWEVDKDSEFDKSELAEAFFLYGVKFALDRMLQAETLAMVREVKL